LVFAKNMLFTNIEIVKNFKSDTLILNTYWSTLVYLHFKVQI